jgi:hypothetical protein
MRTNILIRKDGTLVNPKQNNFINESPINGSAASTLFNNQITLTFYDEIEELENGLFVPVKTSVKKSGLSGTVTFDILAAEDSPYPVSINPSSSINIADSCVLLWYGITDALDITCETVVGAEYINILIDRA